MLNQKVMRYVPYTKETDPQTTEAGHASRASIAKSFGLSYSKFGGSYRSESQAGALRQFPSLAAMASGPIRSTADRTGEVQAPYISAQGKYSCACEASELWCCRCRAGPSLTSKHRAMTPKGADEPSRKAELSSC